MESDSSAKIAGASERWWPDQNKGMNAALAPLLERLAKRL
jgi:hypothetical protein